MKVLKFGGTSMGSIESLFQVKDIIKRISGQKIVVCSAMSGVTNQLVSIVEHIKNKDVESIKEHLYNLEGKHIDVIHSLIINKEEKERQEKIVSLMIKKISELSKLEYSDSLRSKIITYGEAFLTEIFSSYLNTQGISNTLLNAKDFMLVDSVENPNIEKVSSTLKSVLEHLPESEIYITQGFVCRDENGIISDLKRGGSDYSATIIGAAIDAKEVQIWTDINGVHNNDPRCVNDTRSVPYLSYGEASKLAHFGAKILHPKTVLPVIDKGIPVLLKNTFSPDSMGTIISNRIYSNGVKGISAKDEMSVVKIESNSKLMSHDFLKRIFDVFHQYEISVDIITSSEKSISLIIEDTGLLVNIIKEVSSYAKIATESSNSVICVVGDFIGKNENSYKIFDILKHVPVKMISLGKDENNVSILIDTSYKITALNLLQEKLFIEEEVLM